MQLVSSVLLFFKQKTAYEMRISDWSSDVCSSDLATPLGAWLRGLQTQATQARAAGALVMDDLRELMGLPPDSLPFDSLVGYQNYPLDEAGALDRKGGV